jgi:hypothetical protein
VTDVLRSIGMYEGSVTCASITVHVQLVSQAQRYFMCTLTMCTVQAFYQNYILASLQTSIILHDIPELLQHFCKCHACCCNFNDCPSVQNHLLKSYCFHLSLPLYLILGYKRKAVQLE